MTIGSYDRIEAEIAKIENGYLARVIARKGYQENESQLVYFSTLAAAAEYCGAELVKADTTDFQFKDEATL